MISDQPDQSSHLFVGPRLASSLWFVGTCLGLPGDCRCKSVRVDIIIINGMIWLKALARVLPLSLVWSIRLRGHAPTLRLSILCWCCGLVGYSRRSWLRSMDRENALVRLEALIIAWVFYLATQGGVYLHLLRVYRLPLSGRLRLEHVFRYSHTIRLSVDESSLLTFFFIACICYGQFSSQSWTVLCQTSRRCYVVGDLSISLYCDRFTTCGSGCWSISGCAWTTSEQNRWSGWYFCAAEKLVYVHTSSKVFLPRCWHRWSIVVDSCRIAFDARQWFLIFIVLIDVCIWVLEALPDFIL
jgi:hypothetical protein